MAQHGRTAAGALRQVCSERRGRRPCWPRTATFQTQDGGDRRCRSSSGGGRACSGQASITASRTLRQGKQTARSDSRTRRQHLNQSTAIQHSILQPVFSVCQHCCMDCRTLQNDVVVYPVPVHHRCSFRAAQHSVTVLGNTFVGRVGDIHKLVFSRFLALTSLHFTCVIFDVLLTCIYHSTHHSPSSINDWLRTLVTLRRSQFLLFAVSPFTTCYGCIHYTVVV